MRISEGEIEIKLAARFAELKINRAAGDAD
jgi:hypothetical protein